MKNQNEASLTKQGKGNTKLIYKKPKQGKINKIYMVNQDEVLGNKMRQNNFIMKDQHEALQTKNRVILSLKYKRTYYKPK